MTLIRKWWLLALVLGCLGGGCAGRVGGGLFQPVVGVTNTAVAATVTNIVTVTNLVPVVLETTNLVGVTNLVGGGAVVEASRAWTTNSAAVVVTNTTVERVTNIVAVTYTNWLERPAIVAGIGAAGTVVDTFVPGVGTLISLALAGLYGAWARLKNRKVNEALVQGVETARAMLEQTPQGQAVDAEFVRWLQAHQKEAGVFVAVSRLVDQYSDNPAARVAAQEIAGRLGGR